MLVQKRYIILGLATALFFGFQNCSPVQFGSTDMLNDGFNRPVQPNFVELKAGPDQSFPPLKLIFVVDNSGTMGVNQINLSKAFEKMFDGDNATNLSPFESNAMLISTAQGSVDKNNSILSRLPTQTDDQIANMNYSDLMTKYRGQILDGSVPGDLVGYRLNKTTTADGMTSLEYWPAPVASFASFGMVSRASQLVHLSRGGDIEAFKADFRDRLSILNPDRSQTAVTNGVRTGILDPIVDKESGLCALARTLKNNQGLVNPGELAAFVIVSDEDDNDPQGANCLDAIRDQNGADELNDGRCDRPQAQLSYNKAVANPSQPKCTVSYLTGFNYSYSYPVARTNITFYREKYTYNVPRTTISYYTYSGYDYDTEATPVTYYTSAPTYQVPQTKITYYKEVESCVIRDGIKTQCTYTYPSTDVVVTGDYAGNCPAFVNGKIPSDALLNKPGYMPVCAAATPANMSGACSPTDTTKLNCQQNYSTAQTTSLTGRPSNGDCASFVSGKLPTGALYTTSGYLPTCGTTVVTSNPVTSGSCPSSGLLNCRNRALTSNSTTIDNTFASTTTCAQFIKNAKSDAVTDQLATYPVSCTASTPGPDKTAYGTCPTTNINVVNCRRTPEVQTAKAYDGTQGPTQSCSDFASTVTGKPSNAIVNDPTYGPTCAATTARTAGPVTASVAFTGAYASLNPNKGDACPQAVIDSLTASVGVAPSACTVGDPTTGSQDSNNMTCAMTDVAAVCSSSNNAKKNCVGTDTAAGAPYETNATVEAHDGTFDCNTKCSDTTFCTTSAGLVKDNYHNCSVTPLTARTISTFTAQKAPSCSTGDTLVVTNAKYHTRETVSYPVVDKPTQGADKLSEYIKARSTELFGDNTPFVSVFARQPGDPLGTNGSIGLAYDRFADSMGGLKQSVLDDSDGYATALKGLSGMIRARLEKSFQVNVMSPTDQVRRVWTRHAGETNWGQPVDASLWSATGNALTLGKDFQLQYGDEFRIEYW